MKIISDYSDKGVEKTMLVREVILKAIAMDTSDHIWFYAYESHLIAIMDDATGEIYKASIFDSDSTLNNKWFIF